ncbi:MULTISPECIES: hypothetical protein [unclassified Lactococcus]|uniref:hypothetical protein n=1 Tax=unclassified Lactococcus TaxID=2643510 RepID=UPI001295FF73|nr:MULTISPECIES: hypothetical protein [unclassified Lactococcus]MQW24097.1 hypothetical protein [Lactococcus sp. dk101]
MKIILYVLLLLMAISNIYFKIQEGLSLKSIAPLLVAVAMIVFSSEKIWQIIKK